MTADRTSSLTDNQRAYLRLVLQHQSSKEIAQRFGISAHTVDKRIKEAMRILDVGSRVEAAKLVDTAEATPAFRLGAQSPDLEIPANSAMSRPIGTMASDSLASGKLESDGRAISSGIMVGEERITFQAHRLPRHFPLPFPTPGQPHNTLSVVQRLGWTIGLIIGLALATGILLSGLTSLGTLLLSLRH